MQRPTPAMPADLQELSGRFEDWRRTRRGKLPIPEPLWAAAAELARSHGVRKTAQVLRLEYKKLKQLTDEQAGGKPLRRRRSPALATFTELLSPATVVAECVIELEGPRGKLRIQWKGQQRPTWPDSAAYCRSRLDSDHAADARPAGDRGSGWRKGIDSLARLCQEKLQSDPFCGCLFVFRSRRGTSIGVLVCLCRSVGKAAHGSPSLATERHRSRRINRRGHRRLELPGRSALPHLIYARLPKAHHFQ